jgi:hypothetical protein
VFSFNYVSTYSQDPIPHHRHLLHLRHHLLNDHPNLFHHHHLLQVRFHPHQTQVPYVSSFKLLTIVVVLALPVVVT